MIESHKDLGMQEKEPAADKPSSQIQENNLEVEIKFDGNSGKYESELEKAKQQMFDAFQKLSDPDGVVHFDLTPEMEVKRKALSHVSSELIDGFFKHGKDTPEDIEKASQLYKDFMNFYKETEKRGPRMVNEREYEALRERKDPEKSMETPIISQTENLAEKKDMSLEEIVRGVERFKAEGGLNPYYENKQDLVDDLIESQPGLAFSGEQKKMMRKYLEAKIAMRQEELWHKRFKSQHPFFAPIMKVASTLAITPELISNFYYGRKLKRMSGSGGFTSDQTKFVTEEIKKAESMASHEPLVSDSGEQESTPALKTEEASEISLESFSSSIGKNDPKEPVRPNEDQVLERTDKGVYAVFDGVGGHQGGSIASFVARSALSKECDNMPENMSLEETQKFVGDIILKINTNIFENNHANQTEAMSTITLAVVWKGSNGEKKLVVGNLGDSRAYLREKGKLEQITIDDNDLRDKAKDDAHARKLQSFLSNVNSEEEITQLQSIDEKDRLLLLESFKNRHVITKCLGKDKDTTPEITVRDFPSGAELMLSSDGVNDNLMDKEMEQNFGKGLANMALKRSLEGLPRSKPDDISFVIVKNSK